MRGLIQVTLGLAGWTGWGYVAFFHLAPLWYPWGYALAALSMSLASGTVLLTITWLEGRHLNRIARDQKILEEIQAFEKTHGRKPKQKKITRANDEQTPDELLALF